MLIYVITSNVLLIIICFRIKQYLRQAAAYCPFNEKLYTGNRNNNCTFMRSLHLFQGIWASEKLIFIFSAASPFSSFSMKFYRWSHFSFQFKIEREIERKLVINQNGRKQSMTSNQNCQLSSLWDFLSYSDSRMK